MAAVLHVGRERSGRAPAQLEVQAQIANDFLREQADQVGVARQMRVVIGEDFLRGRGAADVIVLLQEQDAQARARQIGRRDQTVMSGAKDDDVVSRFHFEQRINVQPAYAESFGVASAPAFAHPPRSLGLPKKMRKIVNSFQLRSGNLVVTYERLVQSPRASPTRSRAQISLPREISRPKGAVSLRTETRRHAASTRRKVDGDRRQGSALPKRHHEDHPG